MMERTFRRGTYSVLKMLVLFLTNRLDLKNWKLLRFKGLKRNLVGSFSFLFMRRTGPESFGLRVGPISNVKLRVKL